MSNNEILLTAVLANPDDDAPRLTYADWLEQHGERARAEFIRVQCELAKLPHGNQRRAALELLERELLENHEKEWTESLRHQVNEWRFRRGFVESVVIYGELSPDQLKGLFSIAPITNVITVTGGGGA